MPTAKFALVRVPRTPPAPPPHTASERCRAQGCAGLRGGLVWERGAPLHLCQVRQVTRSPGLPWRGREQSASWFLLSCQKIIINETKIK